MKQVSCSIIKGDYMSLAEWKILVRRKINQVDYNIMVAQSMRYRKLSIFLSCVSKEVWPWWIFVLHHSECTRQCRIVSRLLVGEHGWQYQGRVNTHNNRFHVSRLCQFCYRFESDSIPHVLFVCTDGSERRLRLWSDLLVSAPKGMYKSMLGMPSKECTVFVLSGFKCKYVPEWEIVYKVICTFIYDMHAMRMNATECIACT